MNAISDRIRIAVANNLRAYRGIVNAWERSEERHRDAEFRFRCRALFLKHLKGPRILDVGCGLGFDSLAFASSGLKVIATDIVTEFLDRIKTKKGGRCDALATMDMTLPCFARASFNGIFAFASFLHVPGEAALSTLSGFAKMLVPEGILFLHHAASRQGVSEYVIDNLLHGKESVSAFCHSEEEMTFLLESAGFRVVALHHDRIERKTSALSKRYGLETYQIIAGKNE